MPGIYRFQVSYPVHSMLPRDRFVNIFHMQHVAGIAVQTDLDNMCNDIVDLWQTRMGATNREVRCKAYDAEAPQPNLPKADKVKGAGTAWTPLSNAEVCVCLSFAGRPSVPSERGRMYFSPGINRTVGADTIIGITPSSSQQTWALNWYQVSNASLPDLGGIDWKFGIWSRTHNHFTQSQLGWVDNEYDTQRSRGLRPSSRITSVREG